MHDCLRILDILSNIFEHIHSPGTPKLHSWPKPGSSTLASLARTCKAFAEPALDNLWHFQASLVPLILCLPPDAIRVERKEDNLALALHVTKHLYPADYQRILYYGRKIRALQLRKNRARQPRNSRYLWLPDPEPSVVPLLWANRPDSVLLLPMLSHLDTILAEFNDLSSYARFAIGPALRSVSIRIWELDGQYPWNNVVHLLKPAPNISSLTIEGTCDFPEDRDVEESFPLMQLYCSFNHLEYLDTRPTYLTRNILSHLATLNRLKLLKFTIHSNELVQFNLTCPSAMDFPCLTHLWIGTDGLSSCTVLLRRPSFQKLETLEIVRLVADNDGVWELDPFFKSLQDSLSHSCLHTLRILGPGYHTSPKDSVPRVTLGTLAPLFSFPNLTNVEIMLDASVELKDEDLGNVAEAWPKLQVLCLFERTMTRRPKLTLPGLLPLLAMCPELQELTLRMDGSRIPSHAQLGNIRGCNLLSLDVCTSPVSDAPEMVAFLISTFPKLTSLSYGWEYRNKWEKQVDMSLTLDDEQHLAKWDAVADYLLPVHVTGERAQASQERGIVQA